jgi:hypothetical protein
MAVKQYPLDFDALQKGDVISVEQIENIFGIKRTDRNFWAKTLNLRDRIAKEMIDRNRPVTVRTSQGALHICQDREATVYNHKRVGHAYRTMIKAHRRQLCVDVSDFTVEEKTEHDKRLLTSGAMSAACMAVRRSPKLAAAVRKTPGLLGGDGKK